MKTQTIISISWYKHIQLRSQTHINKSDHQSPLLPPISHQWTHQATTTQPTIHPHPPLDRPPLHNHYHRSQPISLSLSLSLSLSKPRSKLNPKTTSTTTDLNPPLSLNPDQSLIPTTNEREKEREENEN